MCDAAQKKTKGCYIKKLAKFEGAPCAFPRCKKKEIKKQNKVSCRDARQRKKDYVQKLERQVEKLTVQNERLKSENGKLEGKSNSRMSEQSNSREMLVMEFMNLMQVIHQKDHAAIQKSLSNLRDSFGIAGGERSKWMRESLLRAVELSMPMHFRLLLESCDDSAVFFDLLGVHRANGDQFLRFTEHEKEILKMVRPKIKKAKQNFNCIFEKVHAAWGELNQCRTDSQKIIDEIQDGLNPMFVGRLLARLDGQRGSNPLIQSIYPMNFYKGIPEQKKVAVDSQSQVWQEWEDESFWKFSRQ